MNENESQSLDVLGIKPVGEAINTVFKGTVDGAAAFLGRICLPAAEEFGLLLRDRVSQWRTQNLIKIAERTERKLGATPDANQKHAHPRLVHLTLENGSWADTDELQEMWAGLLASSCTLDGKDESNLIFVNLLSQLTSSQVKILNYGCENSEKRVSRTGELRAHDLYLRLKDLQNLTNEQDYHRLDRELDHLRTLGLMEGGFYRDSDTAGIKPTPLAFHLYVKCQGSSKSPVEYFDLTMWQEPNIRKVETNV
jgi:hypothetical protein